MDVHRLSSAATSPRIGLLASTLLLLAATPSPPQPRLAPLQGHATPPHAPTNLQLVERTETSAKLSWTPGNGATHGFKIRKSLASGVHPDPGLYPGGKLAAFTWSTDDGYPDNLVYDAIFSARGLHFTAFVVGGTVGNANRLTWDDVRFLHQQGHDIGSHTHDHRALIDDRAISLRYTGAEACSLSVVGDNLRTTIDGSPDLDVSLTDPSVEHLVSLAAVLDALPDYESTLLYWPTLQPATESRHIDPVGGIAIGGGAPAGTLTTARGVHDDAEMLAQILDCQNALEANIQPIDPGYTCRILAYPNHAHTQRAMTLLNELGYVGVRSGVVGARPFESEASHVLGFGSTYESPQETPRPNNAWTEEFTRQRYQDRLAVWKANSEWAILLAHHEGESDSIHVEWMLDEIASDPDVWIATYREVMEYFDDYYTDVGLTTNSAGTQATGWIHGLSETDTTWVVVTAYNDDLEEGPWSGEIAIPPPSTGTAVPPGPVAAALEVLAAPNPFRTSTTFRFRAPAAARTSVDIVNVVGARVRRLDLGRVEAGPVEASWDGRWANGRAVAPGVYFWRVRSGSFTASGKVLLVR